MGVKGCSLAMVRRLLLQSLLYRCVLLIKCTVDCYSDHGDSANRFGIMDLFELDSLQYEVEIMPLPIKKEDIIETDKSSLVMTSKHGQKYHCILPKDTTQDWSTSIDGNGGNVHYIGIADLLKPLRGNCLFVNKGWWSYKYCHGDTVTQFHVEGGVIIGSIVYLGYYDNEKEWTGESLKKAMDHRYKSKQNNPNIMKLPSHDVQYNEGTICALSNQPRSVNAKFTCSPYHTSSEIIDIIEQETCTYTMMIHTPFLCDHPLFIPDSKIGLTSVQCSPILSEYKYKRYMKSLLKKNPSHSEEHKSTVTSIIDSEEQDSDDHQDTIPLLNVLELLTSSIVSKMMVETATEDDENNDGIDNEISEDLDNIIEELVTDSLNKVFGITESKETLKENEDDYPKGPDNVKNGGSDKREKGVSKGANTKGEDEDSHREEGTLSVSHHNKKQKDTTSVSTKTASSGASVLASMLQDILNDGSFEYGENSSNKESHKFEKKRKRLEEQYKKTWEPNDQEEKDD